MVWRYSDIGSQIQRLKPTVCLTFHRLQKFLWWSEMKIIIRVAAWEYTALQLTTNASLIFSAKGFKPHLPSSSFRPLPNTPFTPLNVKLVLDEIHPVKLHLSILLAVFIALWLKAWPTCWTIGIMFCMWQPTYRAQAYTVPQIQDWKILKLQQICTGDLSLISPLI